ncbi:MAG: GNAT family N-acetyltransferase [Spirochaetia bacterium]|jgi:GNAT superfamily N-acetyltransferase|nr:GNAT family N-acetyltransferase [Spirochaetia bacterium]
MNKKVSIVTVAPVRTHKDLKQFIYLPSKIYSGDLVWVPPLWSSEYKEYRDNRNAVLAHSDYQLFLAYRDGRAVGRILVLISRILLSFVLFVLLFNSALFQLLRYFFPGIYTIEIDEVKDLVKKLFAIVDPDAIWFVEDEGIPVGCALGFPDINILIKKIKGKMFPFGFIRFITGLKKIRDYRLWALAVLEKYHGMGLDVLLYTKLYEALLPKGIRMEANYILEDNLHIKNALEKLGMVEIKRYRVYEKEISY